MMHGTISLKKTMFISASIMTEIQFLFQSATVSLSKAYNEFQNVYIWVADDFEPQGFWRRARIRIHPCLLIY